MGSAAEQPHFMVPKGWRIADQAQQHAGQGILEMVPAGETVRSWTRMITVQIFPEFRKYRPGPFIDGMGQLANRVCVKTRLVPVITAKQSGYAFSQKVLSCVRNRAPNIKETTDIKAIKGKQSLPSAGGEAGSVRVTQDRNASRFGRTGATMRRRPNDRCDTPVTELCGFSGVCRVSVSAPR